MIWIQWVCLEIIGFQSGKKNAIVPPHKIRHESYLNTYRIAVGLRESCHEEIEMKLAKDLVLVCKGTASKIYLDRHQKLLICMQSYLQHSKTNLKGKIKIILFPVIIYLPFVSDMPLIYVL